MGRQIARIMSLLAAQTLRNGGEFAEPDYAERDDIEDLCLRDKKG